jgi:hypothetical protein
VPPTRRRGHFASLARSQPAALEPSARRTRLPGSAALQWGWACSARASSVAAPGSAAEVVGDGGLTAVAARGPEAAAEGALPATAPEAVAVRALPAASVGAPVLGAVAAVAVAAAAVVASLVAVVSVGQALVLVGLAPGPPVPAPVRTPALPPAAPG